MSTPAKTGLAILLISLTAGASVVVWLGKERQDSLDVTPPPLNGPHTFNKDVAPIVFEHCATCHRPGESAPFSLLTYLDVKRHAKQIIDITNSRFMPPWLPEPNKNNFVGQRRLTTRQIGVFRRWLDDGAREGATADLPLLPQWTEGWQLGQPDLVITMPESYVLPAEGADVFRNFVIPIPTANTRHVKAFELRPGNKKIVHHANLFVDRTRSSRRLDEKDPGPGFNGMEVGDASFPDGHLLGWTPGKSPDAGITGVSWRLDPGSDLLLQLHMLPTGKPEPIQAAVGLFFDDAPRTSSRAYTVYLKADEALDIPAGAKDYTVRDTFKLPVDARAILVYPHAHYLGKEIQATATLPNGKTQSLIHIKNWDFNWQDSYRYTSPLFLPKDTVLAMRWTFDNSAENSQNPSHPPQRVGYGNRSTDEMAHLYLQLMLRSDREVNLVKFAKYRQRVQKFPGDWTAHTRLGRALESLGKKSEAIASYRRALRIESDYVLAHKNLALALGAQGDFEEAAKHFHRALQLHPDDVNSHFRWAHVLQSKGRVREAIEQYKQTLKIDPQFTEALNNLAWLLATCADATLRQPSEAVELAQRACDLLEHGDAATLDTLAAAHAAAGQYARAEATARSALQLARDAGDHALAQEIQERLDHYQQGEPPWDSANEPSAAAH